MSTNDPQVKPPLKEKALQEKVTKELERIESTKGWVWPLFFLCVTPNILNGFHVSSYVFLAHISNEMWCDIPEFKLTNWTTEQIITISSDGLDTKGCTIYDWNYDKLKEMSYEDALNYTKSHSNPAEIACKSKPGNSYQFTEADTSIVPEWELVCENSVSRTSAQLAVSLGKFIGASVFGILSDKAGRKKSFVLASVLYIVSSVITTASPWYYFFLAGRMGLGASASGIFYPAFALLSENIGLKYRSWMSIAFSASYPIGMLILALAAYLVHPWRYLQLTLTIPGFLLILNCYFMFESPRWLLMKNRNKEAYEIVFKKNVDSEYEKPLKPVDIDEENTDKLFINKLKNSVKELKGLYGQSKMRRYAFTCYFMWCITSLSYYVTALNANNLAANRFLYVAITGCVDLPSYMVPIILLRFFGRKPSACSLFVFAGTCLLIVLAIPLEETKWLVFFAMFGRFGISAVYSIITLHAAELFPTEIRNSALGTSSTMAHIGSMAAPYVVDVLGILGWFIPTTICGSAVLLAGGLMLTLPETGKSRLVDHVKNGESKENVTK